VPLWLDEGIAEYYETRRGSLGMNWSHIRLLNQRLTRHDWQPDLRRLETLQDMSHMNQIDYAEAWLWVHFLLHTGPERLALIRTYLAELRRTATAPPFSQILYDSVDAPDSAVLDHLATLLQY
jgi:hypothetical protein